MTTSPRPPDEEFADWLGDEMTDEERIAFERRLAKDASLAQEAKSLRRTLSMLRSTANDESRAEGVDAGPASRAAPTTEGRPATPAFSRTFMRYAAVILISFAVGYFAGERSIAPAAEGERPVAQSDGRDSESDKWRERAARTYFSRSGTSEFARALIALQDATLNGNGR